VLRLRLTSAMTRDQTGFRSELLENSRAYVLLLLLLRRHR